jgi:hypothetical protein
VAPKSAAKNDFTFSIVSRYTAARARTLAGLSEALLPTGNSITRSNRKEPFSCKELPRVCAHTLIVTLRNCTVKLAGEKSRAAWEQDVRSADILSARFNVPPASAGGLYSRTKCPRSEGFEFLLLAIPVSPQSRAI